MKALVIGLGSMGKRRIRNLRALGLTQMAGMDTRADRRAEVSGEFSVPVFAGAQDALEKFAPDVAIISTPPDSHMEYAFLAFERRVPCFIEASVVDAERVLELHELTRRDGPIVAPSCTMRYFPGPRKIKELITAGAIGRPVNFNYQTGQYLKDWHPWERIEDYYVSRPATAACREIVPFELTWLNDIFGQPEPVACLRDRVGDLGVDIDDVYHFWLRYPGKVTASITIEVLSRPIATRELRVLGTGGQLVFSADDDAVRVASVGTKGWARHALERGRAHDGYINPEEPYVAEMRDFVAAVETRTPSKFPNSLLDDYKVLQTLNALERKCI